MILEQDAMRATVFARGDGRWVGTLLSGAGRLDPPELGFALPLAEFYEGVVPETPGQADAATG